MNSFDFQILHPIDPIELAPGVTMSFQVIPPLAVQEKALAEKKPLSFLMGSRGYLMGLGCEKDEEPRHRVVLPGPFYFGTFPVTQRQFGTWTSGEDYAKWFAGQSDEVEEETPHRNSFEGDPDLPAENLSWYEARAFLRWWNESGIVRGGLEARLPCEAEWEYACRAGTETEYWNGDGEAALREVGWYDGNAKDRTHPVSELDRPNPWGLRDVHGNVWEWCEDVFHMDAYARRSNGWVAEAWKPDSPDHEVRVLRGGSWVYHFSRSRCGYRIRRTPRHRAWDQGFRIVLAHPGQVGGSMMTKLSRGIQNDGSLELV